ncbi:hypothetical protein D3C72_2026680 [compost metagenome]
MLGSTNSFCVCMKEMPEPEPPPTWFLPPTAVNNTRSLPPGLVLISDRSALKRCAFTSLGRPPSNLSPVNIPRPSFMPPTGMSVTPAPMLSP